MSAILLHVADAVHVGQQRGVLGCSGYIPYLALNVLLQRGGRSLHQKRPPFQQQDFLRDALNIRNDVGRQQDRPTLGKPGDQVPKPYPLAGVKAGSRFVQNQDFRVGQHGLHNTDTLAHTAGESADFLVLRIRQVYRGKQPQNPVQGLIGRNVF